MSTPQPRPCSSALLFPFQTRCRTSLFFCSCTDGLCSFIHKGYTNFDLALHLRLCQRQRERVGGCSEVEAEWVVVLLARHPNCSLCLFSMPCSSSGPCVLSIMHECHNRRSRSALATDARRPCPQLCEADTFLCTNKKKNCKHFIYLFTQMKSTDLKQRRF